MEDWEQAHTTDDAAGQSTLASFLSILCTVTYLTAVYVSHMLDSLTGLSGLSFVQQRRQT
jgi:hypothetical protein